MIKSFFEKLPYKKKWVIITLVIWNLLFIPVFIELIRNFENEPNYSFEMIFPLFFAFISAVLLLISSKFRHVVLKNSKTLKHIKKDILLILFLTSLFLILSVSGIT